MTLKIRSMSPKPNQLFTMSQCYIHANLVKIRQPVHEISWKQESVTPTPTPTLTPTPMESAPKTICPIPFGRGTIRIFHECEVRIEKSVIGSLFGITRLCRDMPNSDPEGRIFLFAPNNHDRFFFLHAIVSIGHSRCSVTDGHHFLSN